MKTKIINAKIITDFDSPIILGEMVIEDGIIKNIGEKCDNEPFDEVIDANGNIIMPGFVDAHTHSAMTIFKGLASGEKLENWLATMQRKEKELSGSDVYYAGLLACMEYAKNGITTINDMYHFADFGAKAFNDAGIRAVVGVSQRYNMNKFITEQKLEELYNNISNISPLITASFYCHAIYSCNDNMFGVINKLASKHSTFVSTHVSETLEEVGRCASLNNDMSPIELLQDYGFFDRKALAIHATNVNSQDIEILARNNASVCANFGSNHKLASGVAPIYQMFKRGVNVCLGTDGSASNNRLDMFREMYLASTSQNILLSDANCFKPKDILKMATVNGAKALGLNNVGTLKVGNFADLIMLNTHGIDGAVENDIFGNLVYCYGTEDVLMTMVNGKVIYKNGKYYFKKSEKIILQNIKKIQQKLK